MKFIDAFHEHAGAAGKLLNGCVTFLNNILGNIGKLLSTLIICFTVWVIYQGFAGQIKNVRELPLSKIETMTQQEQLTYFEERRSAYKGALESASAPLATLVGVVVAVVGVGMTFQKFRGNLPSPMNPVISQTVTQEDGNKTTITY